MKHVLKKNSLELTLRFCVMCGVAMKTQTPAHCVLHVTTLEFRISRKWESFYQATLDSAEKLRPVITMIVYPDHQIKIALQRPLKSADFSFRGSLSCPRLSIDTHSTQPVKFDKSLTPSSDHEGNTRRL